MAEKYRWGDLVRQYHDLSNKVEKLERHKNEKGVRAAIKAILKLITNYEKHVWNQN